MFRFVKLRRDHLPMVLSWRIKPRITRWMFTDIENDLDKQYQWFENLKDPHWVIHLGDKPIGILSVNAENHWGYYIGEDDCTALGGLVPPCFYNHFFNNHLILRAEVMAGNDSVTKMHLFHGYKQVGARSIKKPYPVHVSIYHLYAQDWEKQANRYGHYVAEFE